MNHLVIREHNFQRAKQAIKEFSEQSSTQLNIQRVDDTKGVGEFFGDIIFGRGLGLDHKVTGEELNDVTTEVQKLFHSVNTTQNRLIKEFGQVYQALESLDRDYIRGIRDCIRGIQTSIKATEETSRSIEDKQQQITKIANDQKATLVELVKFRNRVDRYVHLKDIDRLWSDCQTSFRNVDKLRSELNKSEKTVDELFRLAGRMGQQLESILDITRDIERLAHLKDIDIIWEETKDHQLRIQKVEQQNASHEKELHTLAQTGDSLRQDIDANAATIQQLQEYRETLNELAHLKDVDYIWQSVEQQAAQITALGKRGDELAAAMKQSQAEVNQTLATALEKNKSEIGQQLTTAFEQNKDEIDQKLTTALAQNQDEVNQKLSTALAQNQGEVEKKLATSLEQHQGEVNQKMTTALAQTQGEVDQKLADALQAANTTVESLSQKVKQAYWIAGGSAVLAGASLVVLLTKVM